MRNTEKPRVAYIDHQIKIQVLFINKLKEKEIDIRYAATLERFLEEDNLSDFPVLLFHPGIQHQHEIGKVRREYPNLVMAIITSQFSEGDYKVSRRRRKDIKVFSYDEVDDIERFIRANQIS